MNKILVTGATGFIGRALLERLHSRQFEVVAVVRKLSDSLSTDIQQQVVDDISSATEWASFLSDVHVVIHTAALVHVQNDAKNSWTEFKKINVEGTLNLARQAVNAGVKRFIFISSIKVNGEMTRSGHNFTADDLIEVTEPYGLSKFQAEQKLLHLAKISGLEVVIIRPPLVYGPGVKANFKSMIKWIDKVIVLPFGRINNKRSFIAIDNLIDLIVICIDHTKASNEVFLISDGEDISTTELLQKMAKALRKDLLLIPVPVGLMKWVAQLIGKGDIADRLFASLQVDDSKTKELLDWKPVITMDEQLQKTADAYFDEKNT